MPGMRQKGQPDDMAVKKVPKKETDQDIKPPYWVHMGGQTVVLTCANGHSGTLDHTVMVNGLVNPSVVCPEDGCDYHEFVMLEGWKP